MHAVAAGGDSEASSRRAVELQRTVQQLEQQLQVTKQQMRESIEPALQNADAQVQVHQLQQENAELRQHLARLEYQNQVLLSMCTVQECDMQRLKDELSKS